MKVFVITKGSYSDYHICAVALDEQEAERLAKVYTDTWDEATVEEFDTDDHQPLLCGRLPYIVKFHKPPGGKSYTTAYVVEDSLEYFEPTVKLSNIIDEVKLYAADYDAAVKIAAEYRFFYMAQLEGLT